MAKPDIDRLAALKAKKDQLAARIAKLEATEKAAARKRELRQKIVVGGAIVELMAKDPATAKLLRELLKAAVTRPGDQEAIADLLAK